MARSQSTTAVIRIYADESVSKSAKVMRAELDKTADSARGITKGTDKVSGSLLSAKESAALLATGLDAAIGILGTGVGAAKALAGAVREAGQSIAVEQNFTRAAGGVEAAATAMERLTQASSGGIDGTTLQTYASKALAAGVSIEQLGQLLEGANKVATATGKNQAEVTEQYVQGIIDMSDGVYKSVGLQVDFGMAVGATAKALNVSADAISVNEKRQILLAKALEETSRAYGSTELDAQIVKLNQLDADWTNLTDTMTRGLAGASVEAAKLVGILDGRTALGREVDDAQDWTEIAKGVGAAAWEYTKFSATLGMYEEATHDLAGTYAKWRAELEGTIKANTAEAVAAREATEAAKEQAATVQKVADARRAQRQLLIDEINKLTEASQTQYDHALALARTATEMGKTTLAAEQYAKAIKAADGAGVSFVDQERLKREAIRQTSKVFRASLEQMIEFESWNLQARKDAGLINDYEYETQLARIQTLSDRLNNLNAGLSETVSIKTPTSTKTPTGSKAPRTAPTAARRLTQSQLSTMDYYDALAREQAEAAERSAKQLAEALAAQVKANEAAERAAQKQIDTLNRLDEAMLGVGRQSLSMASSMASSFGGLGAGIGNAAGIIVDQVSLISATMKEFEGVGLSSTDALVKSVPGMLSASGALVAGFVGDTETKAAIMSAFEFASAIASFATFDYVGGALHTVAGGMYAAIAGGAFSSGGAGAGASAASRPPLQPRAPQNLGQGNPSDRQDSGGNVVIHMSGATIIGSDPQRAGRDLLSMIDRARSKRARPNSSQFVPV